jgi:NAD(P)-dependent dehydrogenase (short-subunit alcohol dehydrogenase family)
MGASLGRLLAFSRVGVLLCLVYSFSALPSHHKQRALLALGLLYYAWRLRFFSRRWALPPPQPSVFITGADTGIGRSTALHLNSLGFRVFAGVLNSKVGASLLAQAKHADALTPIVCDVTQPAQVEAAAQTVHAATGGALWGLVNNAGVALADGPVEFVPMDRVHKTMDVNLFGLWGVTRAFLPLIRQAHGRVVNIASINGFMVWEHHAAYCVSKHGVEALSDCLRMELDPLGCFVACLEPGGIATDIWSQGLNALGESWSEMGTKCWDVYGNRDMNLVKSHMEKSLPRNSDPIVVAQAIHHALSSPFPHTRYKVGTGAGIFGTLRLCPQSWKDACMRKLFGGLVVKRGQ